MSLGPPRCKRAIIVKQLVFCSDDDKSRCRNSRCERSVWHEATLSHHYGGQGSSIIMLQHCNASRMCSRVGHAAGLEKSFETVTGLKITHQHCVVGCIGC